MTRGYVPRVARWARGVTSGCQMSEGNSLSGIRDAMSRSVSRRTALKFMGGGLIASIAAACGVSATPSPATQAPTAPPPRRRRRPPRLPRQVPQRPPRRQARRLPRRQPALPRPPRHRARRLPRRRRALPRLPPPRVPQPQRAARRRRPPRAPSRSPTLASPTTSTPRWRGRTTSSRSFGVHEGLVAWNADWTDFVPALATSWSANADATEWTFNLRTGVTFRTGRRSTRIPPRRRCSITTQPRRTGAS